MRWFSLFRHYGRCERGAVAILFIISLNALILAIALSLDLGRGFLAQTNMGGASDAAALAAAITENPADAEKYFLANMPAGQYGIDYEYEDNVTVTFNPSQQTVTVRPSGFSLPTFFYNPPSTGAEYSLQVANKSVVGLTASSVQPVDYFLILDQSGSMDDFTTPSPVTGQPVYGYVALRESVQMMIDEVFSHVNASQYYSMSLTGYSTVANGTSGLESDPLVLQNILPTYTNNYNDENGWTCGSCGINQAFSYYNTSPVTRQKVYILMTDGEFNTLLDGTENVIPVTPAMEEAEEQCALIKAAPNTTIFSIGFGGGSVGSDTALKECATDLDHYFYAPDGIALGDIFKEIAETTGKLRIVE